MSAAVMRQLPQMPPQLNGEVPSLPDKLHSVDMGRCQCRMSRCQCRLYPQQ